MSSPTYSESEYKAARAAAVAWKYTANAIANAQYAQGDLILRDGTESCAVNARRCADAAEQCCVTAFECEGKADSSTTAATAAFESAYTARRVANLAAEAAERRAEKSS